MKKTIFKSTMWIFLKFGMCTKLEITNCGSGTFTCYTDHKI